MEPDISLPMTTTVDTGLLFLVFLLMPVNWYLEAVQWQILTSSHQKLSLQESFEVVLKGVLFNWIIPFSGGDAIARLKGGRSFRKTGKALFINRITSSLVTVAFFALGGSYYLLVHYYGSTPGMFWPVSFLLVCVSSLYFVFRNQKMVLSFSLCRYLVFSLQLFILLVIFLPTVQVLVLLSGITWIFFFRTFVPSLFGALGIRELSAVMFFETFVADISVVVLATILLWVINIVIPSLLGGLVFSLGNKKVAST